MSNADSYLDAAVIGAGWAGLSVSHALKTAGIGHVVIERRRICETWRTQRWNTFRMNTPNIHTVMPGEHYDGPDPEGFMSRDEFVALVTDFACRRELPVQTETAVHAVRPDGAGGFEVVSSRETIRTRNVVVATGNLNVPKRPPMAARLSPTVLQIDGSDYRQADQLPPGAVLVVGCGNSGGQIAEDLAQSGRKVYLATGRNGRVPRRYRGRDISLWLHETGRYDQPRTAASGRPLLGATHTISLQSLSAMGVVAMGRLADIDSHGVAVVADDLLENARHGDQHSAALKREIDAFIERERLSAPSAGFDEGENVPARFPDPAIRALDLRRSGISTVIWCVGYAGDFRWLKVPGAIDAQGRPVQMSCVSVPGIYFAGLDTPAALKSGTILVAAQEAAQICSHLATRRTGDEGH